MVIGDWNCTPSQPPASIARACGVFRLADEIDGREETPTRRQRRRDKSEQGTIVTKPGRHIDYALHTKGVQIVPRKQWMSPCSSDHDVVTTMW